MYECGSTFPTYAYPWIRLDTRIPYPDDLHLPGDGNPVPLYADNQAAIFMAINCADTSRTKHIDVIYHFLRSTVERGSIRMVYVSTDDNAADTFTKPLAPIKFLKFKHAIGLA